MPRPKKPARLYQRPDDQHWIIRESGKPDKRTGARGSGGLAIAEAALSAHIAQRAAPAPSLAAPEDVTIGEVLDIYAASIEGDLLSSAHGYSIKALAKFWSEMTCADIDKESCAKFVAFRARPYANENPRSGGKGRLRSAGPSTARRDLGALRAALNHARKAGVLRDVRHVELPPAGAARDRWLTRSEAAALLFAASPHVRRFILIALGTGRRMSAILALGWRPSPQSGWVDLGSNVIEFLPFDAIESKKKKGSVSMTRPLRAHMRRWSRDGESHVITYSGKPVLSVKRGIEAAARRAGLGSVTPHTLKHTAVTWAFQWGMTMEDAEDYFATSSETLRRVYRKHSPHHQSRARSVMERRGR